MKPEAKSCSLSDTAKAPRLFALDALRVFAILMMIAYHFIYDLKYFGYVDWNTPLGTGFRQWRTAIVFCFIFAMGLSMGYAHGLGRQIRPFKIRLLQILACAILITVMSLIMFAQSWIYFGILHFMVIASLLTFALIGRPRFAFALGAVIVSVFWVGWVPYGWPFILIPGLPSYTEDFVSPFPWLGVALIGLSLGEWLVKNRSLSSRLASWKIGGHPGKLINFAGSRSLLIYMIHQPILFGILIAFGLSAS